MTAGEFAFLALGLVLGLAGGAALVEVLRARPPAPREVRVTVAPNAIKARTATTLSDPNFGSEQDVPASGGPGDRRWHDDPSPVAADRHSADRRTDEVSVTESADMRRGPAILGTLPSLVANGVAGGAGGLGIGAARPGPTGTSVRIATGEARPMVAVPMSLEPDPLTAALRATSSPVGAGPTAAAGQAGAGRATAAGADADRARATTADSGQAVAKDGPAVSWTGPEASGTQPAGAQGKPGAVSESTDASSATASGPCADERRVAVERCEVASLARAGAQAAAETFRQAQRTYDGLVSAAEAAAAAADPRAVRTAKESAQHRFRDARAGAGNRDDIEAAARTWLAEINRINQETRDALGRIERNRDAAASLMLSLERLAVEADAARISSERADEACVAAREAVAACDEARTLAATSARLAGPAPEAPPGPGEAWGGAATPEPEDESGLAAQMGSRAGQDALILRILRGEQDAMQHAIASLAGTDPVARGRWQQALSDLAEALIGRSIEASAFEFPEGHPFWGPFSQVQNRDIAAGLSSLGFRFDGFGGWVDDRVPAQRDLSLAVGYAGLDPMRIRRWPTEDEMRNLFQDVRVAADEYIAGAAGGLTLGEMVTLLGRRADALAELWNDWGTVRPILLEGG